MAELEGTPWPQRLLRGFARSLRLRLVALFLLLALAMSAAFLGGMQKVMSVGWRDAARPLLMDYVDRLTGELGSPPDVERAKALVRRLPVTVNIRGPQVNWSSHPGQYGMGEMGDGGRRWRGSDDEDEWHMMGRGPALLQRMTADGHQIELGLSVRAWHRQPQAIGWITLTVLLLLTGLSYLYVRRLLRPLDDIRAGAARFGQGDFAEPIPLRRKDELGDLAGENNYLETGNIIAGTPKVFVELLKAISPHLTPILKRG